MRHCVYVCAALYIQALAKRRISSLRSAGGCCVSKCKKSHLSLLFVIARLFTRSCYCQTFHKIFPDLICLKQIWLPGASTSACFKITFHTQLVKTWSSQISQEQGNCKFYFTHSLLKPTIRPNKSRVKQLPQSAEKNHTSPYTLLVNPWKIAIKIYPAC